MHDKFEEARTSLRDAIAYIEKGDKEKAVAEVTFALGRLAEIAPAFAFPSDNSDLG